MARARKKPMVDGKTGEIDLTAYTATTIQSDFFIPSPNYNHDDDEVDRMMDQAMIFVSAQNNPVRKYSIPITPLAKENKKQSNNFFKRLFKLIKSSIGLK